jgi:hypothetical protein
MIPIALSNEIWFWTYMIRTHTSLSSLTLCIMYAKIRVAERDCPCKTMDMRIRPFPSQVTQWQCTKTDPPATTATALSRAAVIIAQQNALLNLIKIFDALPEIPATRRQLTGSG